MKCYSSDQRMRQAMWFDGEDFGLPGCRFYALAQGAEIEPKVLEYSAGMPESLRRMIADWWDDEGSREAVEQRDYEQAKGRE